MVFVERVVVNPKPGEPFEAYGLTWEPFQPGMYRARIGPHVLMLSHTAHGWDSLGNSPRYFESVLECAAWAIRTCPGARCGTCLYHENRRCCRTIMVGTLVSEDGHCHLWTAK